MEAFNLSVAVNNATGSNADAVYTELRTLVPPGKQLVVDFISTESRMPAGQRPETVIVVLKNGWVRPFMQHYLVSFFQLNIGSDSNIFGVSEGGVDIYTSSDPVRMVLARELTLVCSFTRDSKEGGAVCMFGISGHIEPIPFSMLGFISSFVGARS